MDKMKIKTLIVVLAAICMKGIVDGSTCGPNCLNSTETPAGPACNETSGKCLYGCVPGYTGDKCLMACGGNCVNCSLSAGSVNETVCNKCELNHYKNGSQCTPCTDNCQTNSTSNDSTCGQEDGRCIFGCMKNYFGDKCERNCSSNCLENATSEQSSCDRDYGHCSYGCVSGYHGVKCEIECSTTCRQNETTNVTKCNQTDGYCEAGCQNGWFSTQCNETCSVGCAAVNTFMNATCGQDNGYCDFGCLDEYYDETCSDMCSSHCKQSNDSARSCNETTGFCLFSCIDGYFDDKCDKQCSAGCAVNGSSSSQNDTSDTSDLPVCSPVDGSCTFGCYNSSYLADCTGTCSHCAQGNVSDIRACNETDGHCEFGCEKGYFGLKCDKNCSSNCLENSTSDLPTCDRLDGTCTFGCRDTYYGARCDRSCSNKCNRSLCERDGVCSVGCSFVILGGPKCDQPCSVGCGGRDTECDQQYHCAHGCKPNYWGLSCQPCSDDCTNSTSAGTSAICLELDGYCQFGCSIGKHGRTCSETCPGQCKNVICNQTTGECLNKCNKGFYGAYCNSTCSSNCPDNDCYPGNGTCVADNCLVTQFAWYGPSCDMRCPRNCKNKICDSDTGHCSDGCTAGYFGNICDTGCLEGTYGENCARNCSQGCINSTCEADRGECSCLDSYVGATCDKIEGTTPVPITEQLPVLSGSVGGAAALLLIVGIVVLCVWRKKKKEQIVRRRKQKNRKSFSTIIQTVRKSIFSTVIAGPRRILVDNLLTRVKEMQPTDFETDFNDIEETKVEKSDSEAKKAENLSKNCFLDVYPYNENRVVLRSLQQQVNVKSNRRTMDIIRELTEMATLDPDYINASFIEGYASSKQRYIAAQGPIAATTNDFWKMVFQENVSVVVMLTEIEERGLFKQYWPDVGGQSKYGDVTIHCMKQDMYADFCLRRLNLRCFDETRPVIHLQYTSWPSDGAPPTSAGMVEFYHKFLSVEPETDTPTVVHCTSGVGRTGCFIALDLSVDEGNEDHSVDVSQCVTKLREQRVSMVQSYDQYEFLYKTVAQVLCLRSYPVDKENLKKEWKELRKDDGKLIQTTYEDLCESVTLDVMDIESTIKNQVEEGKNRDGSDIPEDRYRPKLASGDYINAVYIDTYKKRDGMIMTQMPTPETVNQFLRLILQEQCHVIVMMNEENPDDTSQFKYWPAYDKATQIGDVFVTTEEILDRVSYLAIKLTLSDLRQNDHSFNVRLYQFAAWKSGDASPKSEVACLSLIRHVLGETGESYSGRILVHCLNGSERSSLFCALYNLIEKLNYEGAVSVVNTVRKIKSRRAKAVPDLEQFRFIYACLVYYIDNFGDDIKYKPDDGERIRSRASSGLKRISQMYAIPNKKKNRKSQLYAKPDKKRKSELYAKPDKKRKSVLFAKSDKKKKGKSTDDRIELVIDERAASGSEQGASGSERAASGSGVQVVYSTVDKERTKQTDSKGETTVYENAGYNETGQKNGEIAVTIEHSNMNNFDDVNILV